MLDKLLINIVKTSCNISWYFLGAGTGGLGLAIEGPSEAKMTCQDNRDGSCSVEYIPTEAGEYDVSIRFSDHHIPGSPFKVDKHLILIGN